MKLGLLAFLLFSISLSGQDFYDIHPEIRGFVAELDSSIRTFERVQLENEEFLMEMTDGGGSLTGYFENGVIKKIAIWVGLSNATASRNFYFKNGNLYFVEEEKNQFSYNSKTNEFDYSQTELVFWGRYLFKPEFDVITHGHDHLIDEIIDMEVFLLEEATRLKNLLDKERK